MDLIPINNIINAVDSAVNHYATFKSLFCGDLYAIRRTVSEARAHELGKLTRSHIQEISETSWYIEQQNLSGPALDMAMDALRDLNELLKEDRLRLNRKHSFFGSIFLLE